MALFQTDNLRVEIVAPQRAQLTLEVAGRPINVLNRQVLTDLSGAFDAVYADHSLKSLLITSPRADFIAGADIQGFSSIATAQEATDLAAFGQAVFDKLSALPVTTIAIIQGVCLGGGLELALACDYRLAVDQPRTQLGFPEIELGILPGWGGTQRLPRLIGLEKALDMILSARRLDAQQALRWGLVDQVARREAVGGNTPEVAFTPVEGKPKRSPYRGLRDRLLFGNPLGRMLVYRVTKARLRQRVPDDMPAPWEALKAIQIGQAQGMAKGLAYEREANGRLAMTPACRNLVGLFLQREKLRKAIPEPHCPLLPQVRRVGLVGAGTMGAGIAQLALIKDFEVVVQEINDQALTAGVQRIEGLFQKAVERGVITAEDAKRKLGALQRTTTWEGFDKVDLAIEAALEDLELKRRIFKELEQRTRPTTILATNTSSLSVAKLQEGLQHPERVAGLHFFNPVHKMPLVEVVGTPTTRSEVKGLLIQWAAGLGKTPVLVGDGPGFVVNRILMPYLDEAIVLLKEGVAIDAIDKVMRRFGMPMGPLELLDQVGLDVSAHIAQAMQPLFGDRGRSLEQFQLMKERGWLGQKSGTGFYCYDDGKKRAPNPELQPKSPATLPAEQIRDRLVLPMVHEAAAVLKEGLAASAEEIDLAMVMGTGWAPHRGGPLRYGKDRGLLT